MLQWKDVIAKAPTGTGKTFAFGIPMLEHIDSASDALQGLVLAPTRELAIQICDELRSLLAFQTGHPGRRGLRRMPRSKARSGSCRKNHRSWLPRPVA